MAERLRAPGALLVLAGAAALVGLAAGDSDLRNTCMTAARLLAIIGVLVWIAAPLWMKSDD